MFLWLSIHIYFYLELLCWYKNTRRKKINAFFIRFVQHSLRVDKCLYIVCTVCPVTSNSPQLLTAIDLTNYLLAHLLWLMIQVFYELMRSIRQRKHEQIAVAGIDGRRQNIGLSNTGRRHVNKCCIL